MAVPVRSLHKTVRPPFAQHADGKHVSVRIRIRRLGFESLRARHVIQHLSSASALIEDPLLVVLSISIHEIGQLIRVSGEESCTVGCGGHEGSRRRSGCQQAVPRRPRAVRASGRLPPSVLRSMPVTITLLASRTSLTPQGTLDIAFHDVRERQARPLPVTVPSGLGNRFVAARGSGQD